jgi:type II secretory pathway pseudopilin PulG
MIRDERGTTLAELLLVLAIIGMITGVLVMAMYQILNITGWGNNELAVQHDLRNAAVWLNRDVLSASKATVSGSQMVLEVPYLGASSVVTRTITYTYDPTDRTLTRDSGDVSFTIAKHLDTEPFASLDKPIQYPNDVVTVTLRSREGNVPGSGTFALKMRAGGYITSMRLCLVTGVESLGFDGNTVSWVITNTGQTSPSIDELYITWPSANSGLTLIDLDTSSIWDGLVGGPDEPSATISGGWLGDVESREIVSGTQKTLEFTFESSAVVDETQYSIIITLTDKCTFPFPPNP